MIVAERGSAEKNKLKPSVRLAAYGVGAVGLETLYLDVVTTLAQALAAGHRGTMPRLIGGRFGLGSKNFSPAHAKAVFDELKKPSPRTASRSESRTTSLTPACG